MDTGTHLITGATLGGLAVSLADPALLSHSTAVYGLLAAAVIGSNAPDFDSVTRIYGYKTYMQQHRGFSHSLPMLAVWPVALAPLIALAFDAWAYLIPIFLWTLAGVVFHVFLDFFNAYGVQCFRPLSRKWFHADTIPIFDPILFFLHAAGLLLWMFDVLEATSIFPLVYMLSFVFIGFRILTRRFMLKLVSRRYGLDGYSFLIPQGMPHEWKYVHETGQAYITGSISGMVLKEEAIFEKGEQSEVIQAAMGSDGVRTFLRFTNRVHISCQKLQNGYKVELRDIRFRHGHKLPFGMDVTLDERLQVTGDTIGWRKKMWEPPFA